MENLEATIVNTVFSETEPKKQFLKGNIAKNYLLKYAKIIKELSDYYVNNKKDNISLKMKEDDVAKAYALYYLPINFYKISFLYSKILENIFKDKIKIALLDYGSGPATGALASCDFFEKLNIPLDITLFDESTKMLNIGKNLLKGYTKNRVDIFNNLNDVKKKKYDVITMLNVVNELDEQEQKNLIDDIGKLLNKDGILIILEPALKDLARGLMAFRNNVLERYNFSILYPCFHTNKCEMLKLNDDWCHGELQGLNSRLVKQIDEITGFNKHKIKYSSVIFYRNENYKNDDDFYRIVNIPKETNRGLVLNICGKECFKEMVISKDKVKENKKLKKLKFFDEINKEDIS